MASLYAIYVSYDVTTLGSRDSSPRYIYSFSPFSTSFFLLPSLLMLSSIARYWNSEIEPLSKSPSNSNRPTSALVEFWQTTGPPQLQPRPGLIITIARYWNSGFGHYLIHQQTYSTCSLQSIQLGKLPRVIISPAPWWNSVSTAQDSSSTTVRSPFSLTT